MRVCHRDIDAVIFILCSESSSNMVHAEPWSSLLPHSTIYALQFVLIMRYFKLIVVYVSTVVLVTCNC